MKQRIEPPNEDEQAWIAENLEFAKRIVATCSGGTTLNPESLDRALVAWSSQSEAERIEPNDLVNILGIAFGQYLVEDLRLDWAVVTDEHGTELAVHGEPSDILVFPAAVVAKRIDRAEGAFFKDLYQQLSLDIGRLRRRVH